MTGRNETIQSRARASLIDMSNQDQEADESLAARAASDPDAFAELYLRYATPIRRYLSLRLGDSTVVDDVTSEVFVKALESLHKTSVKRVRPWLFTIAHHKLTDRYRRQRDEIDLDRRPEIRQALNHPGQKRFAVAKQKSRPCDERFGNLPPAQAHVIELRLAGLDGPEIRQVLNRSRSWVDTTQYRAMINLRSMLNPAATPEER